MENKNALIDGISNYFRSCQWKQTARILTGDHDVQHGHVFIHTSVDPWSLEKLWKLYFGRLGWEHYRERNDHCVSGGWGAFTINPRGLPHFSVYFKHKPDAVLVPAMGFEGKAFDHWGTREVGEYIRKYEQIGFRTIGQKELAEIRDYFQKSEQWQEAIRLTQDPKIGHFHVLIETSIHPKQLEKFVREDLESRNLRVERIVQMVYGWEPYRGKITVMTENTVTWDFAWTYNLCAVLKPSCHYSGFTPAKNPEFDAWTISDYESYIKKDKYTVLSDKEITEAMLSIFADGYSIS